MACKVQHFQQDKYHLYNVFDHIERLARTINYIPMSNDLKQQCKDIYKDISDVWDLYPDDLIHLILFFQDKLDFQIQYNLLEKIFLHVIKSELSVIQWWGVLIITNEASRNSVHTQSFLQSNELSNIVRIKLKGWNGDRIKEEFINRWKLSEVNHLKKFALQI